MSRGVPDAVGLGFDYPSARHALRQRPYDHLANKSTGELTVSTGNSARSSTRGFGAAPISPNGLDPGCARGTRLEGIGKVLCFASDLAITELHHAHRIGRLAVVCEYEFRYPEITLADHAAYRKALGVWLRNP